MATDFSQYNTDTNVRYIDYTMYKSPSLGTNIGDLVKLLKTVLVDGFNSQKVNSVTVDQSTNIATLNVPTSHGFLFNQVITISGATPFEFNGDYRVLYADGTTIQVKLKSNITEISGTISVKTASLGYSLAYNDITNTGTACFKNSSQTSPAILKVIDALPPNGYDATWARFARVVAGQAISSAGKFTNNEKTPYHKDYPLAEETGDMVSGIEGIHSSCRWDYARPQYKDNGGGYADDWNANSLTGYPTNWKIIGDSNTFYLFIQPMGQNYSGYAIYSFGLYKSNNPNETYNIYLVGNDGWVTSSNYAPYQTGAARRNSFTTNATDRSFGLFLFKSVFGNTQHWLTFTPCGLSFSETNTLWTSKAVINPINANTGAILSSPILIKDSNRDLRGELRGIKQFYGSGELQNNILMDGNNSIVLQTKLFEWSGASGNSEQVPYLFSFKNWEL